MSATRFLLLLCLFALLIPVWGREGNPKHKLAISGTLYYTSESSGGMPRDNSHLPSIPLRKYALHVVRFIAKDSISIVVKSFTTDNEGRFSVSLPAGSYGFVTTEDLKNGLAKGQVLPKPVETSHENIRNSSVWECTMACPIDLDTASVRNLVITDHLSSFCVNCQ